MLVVPFCLAAPGFAPPSPRPSFLLPAGVRLVPSPQASLRLLCPAAAAAAASAGQGKAATASGLLRPGDAVRVGGRNVTVEKELGRGNFGVVWEVREVVTGLLAALKVSTPSADSTEAAVFEVDVLRRLASGLGEAEGDPCHAPRYFAHEVSPVPGSTTGRKSITCLMSKVAGGPLDKWIYGASFNEDRLRSMAIREVLEGPLPESQLATRSLAEAAGVARELLLQLAPVFGVLDGIAFHRDVSAHNCMVQETDGKLTFALIDFGLAVRSSTWRTDCRNSNLAGTPNYFPPSTWMLFTHGHRYLEQHPNQTFLRQYQERLDYFAVGVLSLELLFALWDGKATDAKDAIYLECRTRWRAYWTKAVTFYQGFFNKGGAKFRTMLMGSCALSELADAMHALIVSLRSATKDASGDDVFAKVFRVAADLLDSRGATTWGDVPQRLRTSCSQDVESEGLVEKEVAEIQRLRTFSHRRVWTVDEAVSLKRNVVDVLTLAAAEGAAEVGTALPAVGSCGGEAPAQADWEVDLDSGGIAQGRNTQHRLERLDSTTQVDLDVPSSLRQAGPPRHSPREVSPVKKFSHRRVWTVDEAVSLKRGVVDICLAQHAGEKHQTSEAPPGTGTPRAEGAERPPPETPHTPELAYGATTPPKTQVPLGAPRLLRPASMLRVGDALATPTRSRHQRSPSPPCLAPDRATALRQHASLLEGRVVAKVSAASFGARASAV